MLGRADADRRAGLRFGRRCALAVADYRTFPAAVRLDAATAEELYGILDDCSGGLYEASVTSILAGDESKRACVEEALTEEQLKQVFIAAFQGQEDGGAAYSEGLTACMTG